MRIIRADVELQSGHEVTVNGRRLLEADFEVEEKIIAKQMTVDQQWQLICLFKKNLNKLYSIYRAARIASGEITEAELRMRERRNAVRKHNPRLL